MLIFIFINPNPLNPMEEKREIRYSSDKHKTLHLFLRKINNVNFTKKWFDAALLDSEVSKTIPFPLTSYENFKYNIDEYLWNTFVLYGDLEVKVMFMKSKDFKKNNLDASGYFMFCMSIKPEPKPAPEKKIDKTEKVVTMKDLDLFSDEEVEEIENEK